MKILLVSGFLGAGKTTFIQELTRCTGREFVILENEYSSVPVDGALLNASQNDAVLNIWEMTEGCVCCSTKADFATSILTISNTLDPEYLVVEPTGVGQLSRIIENVAKLTYERIQLLAPITVLDGRLFDQNLLEYPAIFLDQIQAATTVVVSHFEGATSEEQAALSQKVSAYNKDCEILTTPYQEQSKAWWQELLTRSLDGTPLPAKELDLEQMEHLGLQNVGFPQEISLILFLERLIRGEFGKIVRGKGYLKAGPSWLRFDVMHTNYTIAGIEPQKDSRAVWIGEGLKRNEIRKILQTQMFVTLPSSIKRR